ncbi:hypothetical protein SSX86_001935 [Deinandra increscens subsp. villosa]|uniref:Glycerol-3-phosphate acyltransferase RAM2/GPAT1-8 HAD-like domain-containing protein n=1 Tax=Deinandra increscens subsp. villosa TaxID=3103831 RepID=A0AAP0DZZ7_9ASTR
MQFISLFCPCSIRRLWSFKTPFLTSSFPTRHIALLFHLEIRRHPCANLRYHGANEGFRHRISGAWRVFSLCGKRCVLTANLTVIVEPFLKEFLGADMVLGMEIGS